MREDMAKVIVERPRVGGAAARKGRRKDWDSMPSHEGMRRPHKLRGDPKGLNEHLGPLRRYLEKQVGRPWDKVYSEIAERLRVDNVVQQHVRDHLHDFVAIKPRRLRSWRSWYPNDLWWQRLYVDPRTGLLCRTDNLAEEKARRRETRNRPSKPVERVPLTGDHELRHIDGIWYDVRLAPLPEPVFSVVSETRRVRRKPYDDRADTIEMAVTLRRLTTPPVRDVVTGGLVRAGPMVDEIGGWSEYRRQHPDRRYAIAKRTLSRRELRRYGLFNNPKELD